MKTGTTTLLQWTWSKQNSCCANGCRSGSQNCCL